MLNGKASDLQVHYNFALFNTRAKPTPKVKPCSLKVKKSRESSHRFIARKARVGYHKNHDRSINSIQTWAFFLPLIAKKTNLYICKNVIQISLDSVWGKSPYKCSERWLCR